MRSRVIQAVALASALSLAPPAFAGVRSAAKTTLSVVDHPATHRIGKTLAILSVAGAATFLIADKGSRAFDNLNTLATIAESQWTSAEHLYAGAEHLYGRANATFDKVDSVLGDVQRVVNKLPAVTEHADADLEAARPLIVSATNTSDSVNALLRSPETQSLLTGASQATHQAAGALASLNQLERHATPEVLGLLRKFSGEATQLKSVLASLTALTNMAENALSGVDPTTVRQLMTNAKDLTAAYARTGRALNARGVVGFSLFGAGDRGK